MIGKVVSHYKILEHLGGGGMGVVYKAQDLKLDRFVALKFLPSELTRDPEAKQRFVHEAKAASVIQHNNICVVHDIDETNEGQMFISMECLEGETLKKKIERGPLKIEEATDFTIQVAQGLVKAHEHGVVHRDIKPSNIMVTTDGVAKLVDFGLAKLAGQARLTRTGSTIGTAAYMSPEQAQGGRVDQRTDIWSLGVVLYEMVTGKLPFRGEHEAALLYSIVHEDMRPISGVRGDIPRALGSVIQKTLQKDPAQRYPSARELMQDLTSAILGTAELPKQEKSIVVLPFENLSPDPDNAFFADGLTDELIAELSRVRSLRVISRTSAMLFKGAKKSVPAIAGELSVRYVLEGTVRRAGENLRITAQLIDAATDAHLWAERYSGTVENVLDLQEHLSRRIVDALEIPLSFEEERRLSKRSTSDPRSYEAWLRARHEAWSYDGGGFNRAINLTNEALALVGDDPLLFAGLGYLLYGAYDFGVSYTKETLDRAEIYASKSLELDPDQSHALITLGLVKYKRGGVKAEFIRYAKRAVDVDRNCDALSFLGFGLAEAGKMAEARHFADEAIARDPLTLLPMLGRTVVDLFDGNFDEAFFRLREWIQKLGLESPLAVWWLGQAAAFSGREEEAIAAFDRGARMEGGLFSDCSALAGCALRGDRGSVLDILARTSLREVARTDEYYPCHLANCLTRVGEKEEALQWLEQAVSWGFTNHRFLSELNPFLEPLRGEERFRVLMERARKQQQALQV